MAIGRYPKAPESKQTRPKQGLKRENTVRDKKWNPLAQLRENICDRLSCCRVIYQVLH